MNFEKIPDIVAPQNNNIETIKPFPLIKELFDFARQNLDHPENSYDEYVDQDCENREDSKKIGLPAKLQSIVKDYPGDYSIVYYINRLDSYYAKGTRMQDVGLSTSQYRYLSDDPLREISIEEHDPSDNKGKVVFLTVKDSINNRAFITMNTAEGTELNQSNGSRELKHEIDTNGNKKMLSSSFNRLDEGLFFWGGEEKPVRWVRDLDILLQGSLFMII